MWRLTSSYAPQLTNVIVTLGISQVHHIHQVDNSKYAQMKLIFSGHYPNPTIELDAVHLALGHLVEDKAQGINYLRMTLGRKMQWYVYFIRKYY